MPRGEALIVADEHLATLLLDADPALAAELRARAWRRSTTLDGAPRERLEGRCARGWTTTATSQAVGAALGVHPQTVRYRLGQLRELFGERREPRSPNSSRSRPMR